MGYVQIVVGMLTEYAIGSNFDQQLKDLLSQQLWTWIDGRLSQSTVLSDTSVETKKEHKASFEPKRPLKYSRSSPSPYTHQAATAHIRTLHAL